MATDQKKKTSLQQKKTMVLEFDTFRQSRSLPSAGGLTWMRLTRITGTVSKRI
jgi:hypothetical protein